MLNGEIATKADDALREELKQELRAELREELRRELLEEEEEEEQDRPETEYPWIVFAIGGIEYGINSKYVLSIEILGTVTPLVDSEHHSPGITESRGEMIELLDLRDLFGQGDYKAAKGGGKDDRYMMMVVEASGKKKGVIVDDIVATEHITRLDDHVPGASDCPIKSKYVRQVAIRDKSDSPVLIIKQDSLIAL